MEKSSSGGELALKVNFHTHSTFCDGKSTLEENVSSALSLGMKILGFSSHSTWPNPFGDSIKKEDFPAYKSSIEFLAQKHSGQLDIRFGFEADYIKGFCRPDFAAYKDLNPEFLIGSVHYLNNGEDSPDKMLPIDYSAEKLMEGLETLYKGDTKLLIGHYFATEREMLSSCSFSIIGHPDLVRKFNEKVHFFDESEEWYKNELKETAKAISRSGVIAEINTGAISRGYTTKPYPSQYFLELLHECNVPVMLASDSHNCMHINFAFEQALALAKKTGYTELAYPDKGKISFYKI